MTGILIRTEVQSMTALLSAAMAFVGGCAILVSIITEALKNIPQTDRIPTKLLCYLVAMILTPVVYCELMDYLNQPIEWYRCFASFLASFVVAKVSMNGWDDVAELADRMLRE